MSDNSEQNISTNNSSSLYMSYKKTSVDNSGGVHNETEVELSNQPNNENSEGNNQNT